MLILSDTGITVDITRPATQQPGDSESSDTEHNRTEEPVVQGGNADSVGSRQSQGMLKISECSSLDLVVTALFGLTVCYA